jgi:hypothetical protein
MCFVQRRWRSKNISFEKEEIQNYYVYARYVISVKNTQQLEKLIYD